ncbi:hypothetical protein [Phaeovulum sp.]|uniref:hypothetical protein n=1 Tax=Phaeovulum sp. TaxID=2934796 RepID=UPI0039E4B4B8
MGPLKRLGRWLRGWNDDTTGSMPIEGIMGFLLLIGWFMVSFQFYDAFRLKAVNAKAAYTIADLLSREKGQIGPKYIQGMQKVFDFVTNSRGRSWIRVTSIRWDDDLNKYRVEYSHASKPGIDSYTDVSLNKEAYRIPLMPVGDTAIIVETSMRYTPIFTNTQNSLHIGGTDEGGNKLFTQIGLTDAIRFSNFVVTRPRGPRVVWDSSF